MASAPSTSSRASRSWSQGTARAAAYRLHVLVGFVVSLGAVTAAFRVPWGSGPGSVGWGAPAAERFEISFEETEPRDSAPGADLVSRYRIGASQSEASPHVEEDLEPRAFTASTDERAPVPELGRLAPILEFAEEVPQLVGGLGSLYLHIRYPQAAIEQNIQGRVVLQFVVEPDGRTSEIVVERSLHALCDSAAVQALREVTFVPGRQNGEAARVRMRLPVRFQLVSPSGAPLSDSSLATAG